MFSFLWKLTPVRSIVFRDIAASDKDAGDNKNIHFAIVAGNGDIVSYVCFYGILFLLSSDIHDIYRVINHNAK